MRLPGALRAIAIALAATARAAAAQDAGPTPSGEPKHIALIIGNTDYSPENKAKAPPGRLPRLPNACGDSQTIAAALVQVGWSEGEITQKCNLTTTEMLAQIRTFVQDVQDNPYSIAIFYFAGHGVQIDTKSFIFGVDAKPNFALARSQIASNNNAQLFFGSALEIYSDFVNAVGAINDGGFTVILDACRSDPVIKALGGGARNVTAPLARSKLLPGVLLALSTQDGDTAADSSSYASTIRRLIKRQTPIASILNRVATQVFNDTKLTGHPQIPTTSGGLVIPCFAGCSLDTDTPAPPVRTGDLLPLPAPRLIQASYSPPLMPQSKPQPQPQPQRVDFPVQSKRIQNETLYADPGYQKNQLVRGMRADVFWCEGGGNADAREAMARRYGDVLTNLARGSGGAIVSVRLRSLTTSANGLPIYRFLHNAIVADPLDSREAGVVSAVDHAGVAPLERLISQSTPNYVSVFICAANPRASRATVNWQASGDAEEALAANLIGRLNETLGQFHSDRKVDNNIPPPPADTEVRYFFADDRDVAFKLADSLQQALHHAVAAKLFADLPNAQKPGKLEVWIGTNELSRAAATAVDPGSPAIPSRNSVLLRQGT